MGTEMTLETNAVAAPSTSKSITRHFPAVARVLLGLLFLVAGLNGFLNFLPQPSGPIPEGAAALGMAFMKAGYMFPLIKGTEVLVAVLLLANRFVPLALAILAPVAVNILAFHAFLAPSGVAIPVVVLAMEIYLAWSYRKAYRPMLAMRATPGAD